MSTSQKSLLQESARYTSWKSSIEVTTDISVRTYRKLLHYVTEPNESLDDAVFIDMATEEGLLTRDIHGAHKTTIKTTDYANHLLYLIDGMHRTSGLFTDYVGVTELADQDLDFMRNLFGYDHQVLFLKGDEVSLSYADQAYNEQGDDVLGQEDHSYVLDRKMDRQGFRYELNLVLDRFYELGAETVRIETLRDDGNSVQTIHLIAKDIGGKTLTKHLFIRKG